MPTLRLRKRLIDRLVKGANSASELALALLMTAGVVHCGGSTQTDGEGTADSATDHGGGGHGGGVAVEAGGGIIVEVAAGSFGIEAAAGGLMVEAPAPRDAGSDGHPIPVIEAPPPPREAGSDATDAGSDSHISPMVEAPFPLRDN